MGPDDTPDIPLLQTLCIPCLVFPSQAGVGVGGGEHLPFHVPIEDFTLGNVHAIPGHC